MGLIKSKCQTTTPSVGKISEVDMDNMSFREMYEREQGRAKLRNMVTSSKEGKINWEQIITTAQELHVREQKLIKQRKNKLSLFMYSRRRKEMRRRRKTDSCGSFGVNLLTIPGHNKEIATAHNTTMVTLTGSLDPESRNHSSKSLHKNNSRSKNFTRTSDNSISRSGASISTSTSGTMSANRDEWDDCVFTRSWDEGMTPIFENEI